MHRRHLTQIKNDEEASHPRLLLPIQTIMEYFALREFQGPCFFTSFYFIYVLKVPTPILITLRQPIYILVLAVVT